MRPSDSGSGSGFESKVRTDWLSSLLDRLGVPSGDNRAAPQTDPADIRKERLEAAKKQRTSPPGVIVMMELLGRDLIQDARAL